MVTPVQARVIIHEWMFATTPALKCGNKAIDALRDLASQVEALQAQRDDLMAVQTMGAELNTPDFLDWIADRLVSVYKESNNVDFVRSLRERAKAGRSAIAKAKGQP